VPRQKTSGCEVFRPGGSSSWEALGPPATLACGPLSIRGELPTRAHLPGHLVCRATLPARPLSLLGHLVCRATSPGVAPERGGCSWNRGRPRRRGRAAFFVQGFSPERISRECALRGCAFQRCVFQKTACLRDFPQGISYWRCLAQTGRTPGWTGRSIRGSSSLMPP
jgi:hypothetical protein